jgi:hypothetical protein
MPFWESPQLQPLRARTTYLSRDCQLDLTRITIVGEVMFRMAEQAGCCVSIFRRCRRGLKGRWLW